MENQREEERNRESEINRRQNLKAVAPRLRGGAGGVTMSGKLNGCGCADEAEAEAEKRQRREAGKCRWSS